VEVGLQENKEFCIVWNHGCITINESHRICTVQNHLDIAIKKIPNILVMKLKQGLETSGEKPYG
jgi:predicted nucleotidyltransferase